MFPDYVSRFPSMRCSQGSHVHHVPFVSLGSPCPSCFRIKGSHTLMFQASYVSDCNLFPRVLCSQGYVLGASYCLNFEPWVSRVLYFQKHTFLDYWVPENTRTQCNPRVSYSKDLMFSKALSSQCPLFPRSSVSKPQSSPSPRIQESCIFPGTNISNSAYEPRVLGFLGPRSPGLSILRLKSSGILPH